MATASAWLTARHTKTPKPDEAAIAGKRAAIAQGMLDNGVATVDGLRGNDLARQAIIGELIESMGNQNKTYAVVDGFSIPASKVRIIRIPRTAREIVLASDGYPHLKPTLDASEEALEKQLAADPLNIRLFKATKGWVAGNNSFDDRTYPVQSINANRPLEPTMVACIPGEYCLSGPAQVQPATTRQSGKQYG